MAEGQSLRRELSLAQAVAVGVGAMVGGGIAITFSEALHLSHGGIWIALGLAALVALLNGLSSAQCAVRYPTSGGTFEYATELIHPIAGWIAGWAFVISKVAAGSIIALALGYDLTPAGASFHVGWSVGFVALLVGADLLGIKKVGSLNLAIVAITVGGWLVWVGMMFTASPPPEAHLPALKETLPVFGAAGLLFFAFTGYARIATLAEEVKEPTRTIPRAIGLSILIVTGLYALIIAAIIHRGGVTGEWPTNSFASLDAAIGDLQAARLVLDLVLITSMFGVLLSQILSVSRVLLAMARRTELPPMLTHVDAAGVPRPMILLTGFAIASLAVVGGVQLTLPLAIASILVYYGLTHLAVLRIPGDDPPYPKFIASVGLLGCAVLGAAVLFLR